MPFRSQSQRAKFHELVKQGKMSQETLDKWESETPKHKKLPERITAKKSPLTSIEDLRALAKKKLGR